MKLYGYWRSTAAYRVRIALNLKGAEYDTIDVDLVKNGGDQHKDWYKSINPQQLVPSLQLNDGSIIGQSIAIIEYLEETIPQPPLLPKEPLQRAQVRQIAQLVAMDIHPLNNLRVLNYLKTELDTDQAHVNTWYHHWLEQGFAALEALLDEAGPCAAGTAVTLADVLIVPQLYNAHRVNFGLERFPGLRRLEKFCLGMDAFARAAPERQ